MLMWQLARVDNPAGSELQFTDGRDLFAVRGGAMDSVRLAISKQGFIDFTNIEPQNETRNNGLLSFKQPGCLDVNNQPITSKSNFSSPIRVHLMLPGDGSFRFSLNSNDFISGALKPLPKISKTDVEYFQRMIDHGPVPAPTFHGKGKTSEEMKALGSRYFPFSPNSFQLAMAVYDWTTTSFIRMVLMKMFEYTGINGSPAPLDEDSVATMIFNSNWKADTPDNPEYMRGFLMKPAKSKQEVVAQLERVLPELRYFSDVENRILVAAAASMPRIPKQSVPILYSGQPDIQQFGLARFGVQLTQCPLNAGPPGIPLQIDLDKSLDTFLHPGKVITTKQFWSFSDSMDIAMSYQNGIVLVVHPPDDGSLVWETPCYVTPLSCDESKVEWVYPLGTSFIVLATERRDVNERSVLVITLKQIASSDTTRVLRSVPEPAIQKFASSLPLSNSTPAHSNDRKLPLSSVLINRPREWVWCPIALSVILSFALFVYTR